MSCIINSAKICTQLKYFCYFNSIELEYCSHPCVFLVPFNSFSNVHNCCLSDIAGSMEALNIGPVIMYRKEAPKKPGSHLVVWGHFGSFQVFPKRLESPRWLKKPVTTGDFNTVICGRNGLYRNARGSWCLQHRAVFGGNLIQNAMAVQLTSWQLCCHSYYYFSFIVEEGDNNRFPGESIDFGTARPIFQRRESLVWYHTLTTKLRLSDRQHTTDPTTVSQVSNFF